MISINSCYSLGKSSAAMIFAAMRIVLTDLQTWVPDALKMR